MGRRRRPRRISGRRGGSEAPHPDARVQASPAPSLLSLTAIAKSYGSVIALAGIDLQVPDGEIVTILGPSGSGKTTLLKIVAGFELPDAGRVELAGDDITCVTPASRGIGMVFQNYALFPHMRVAENIAFPLEMRRLARAETQERVSSALALVGLAGYEARYPRQLSGGQQQRVALARAIVFEPRLLLLDEPFGALDRKLRDQMQLEVKRLQRQLGITALFVTHDQEEALAISDRIAVMNAGRIEQIGAPEELYLRPRTALPPTSLANPTSSREVDERFGPEASSRVRAVARAARACRPGARSPGRTVSRRSARGRRILRASGETAENVASRGCSPSRSYRRAVCRYYGVDRRRSRAVPEKLSDVGESCGRPGDRASASAGAGDHTLCSASHDRRDRDPSRPCRAAAVERRPGPRLAALPLLLLALAVLPLPRPADPVAQPDQPGRRAVGSRTTCGRRRRRSSCGRSASRCRSRPGPRPSRSLPATRSRTSSRRRGRGPGMSSPFWRS